MSRDQIDSDAAFDYSRFASCPAFRDTRTGETHLSVDADGTPSAQHTFERLPESWIAMRDADGGISALHPAIEAGYWRNATFVGLGELLVPRPND